MGNIAGGIFILIMGTVIIVLGKESGNLRVLGIAGAVMALFGALVIWEEIWGLNDIGRLLMVWLPCGSLGFMCLYAGLTHLYIKLFCCRRKVTGTFLEVKRVCYSAYRSRHSYVPVFQYHVEGSRYRGESEESYLRKGRLEKYQKPTGICFKTPAVSDRHNAAAYRDHVPWRGCFYDRPYLKMKKQMIKLNQNKTGGRTCMIRYPGPGRQK